MDNKLKLPSMNAFFIEDPDEPGSMAIPVVMINGEKIMLNNIRDERLDFFRPMVAAISKEVGAKAYFVKYENPSFIEEIEAVDNPNITSVTMDTTRPPNSSDMIKELTDMVGEIIVKRIGLLNNEKPDKENVH